MDETKLQQIARWVGMFTAVLACLIGTGPMSEQEILPRWVWFPTAVLGGAIGMGCYTSKTARGIFCGAITGALAYIGLRYYVEFRVARLGGPSLGRPEFLLVMAVSTAPGFLLFYWLTRETPRSEGFADPRDESESGTRPRSSKARRSHPRRPPR